VTTETTVDGTTATARIPMYTPEFAADPHGTYAEMRRRHGSLVPVLLHPDVPATLVIGYHTALKILHDQDRFPADPRRWEADGIEQSCPVKPMMEWRPNALRSSGVEHARYRGATCGVKYAEAVWAMTASPSLSLSGTPLPTSSTIPAASIPGT